MNEADTKRLEEIEELKAENHELRMELASLCDAINVEARENNILEADYPTKKDMLPVVRRIVDKKRNLEAKVHAQQQEIERLRAELSSAEKEMHERAEGEEREWERAEKAEADIKRWKFDADTTREAHICTGRERDRLTTELNEAEVQLAEKDKRIEELEKISQEYVAKTDPVLDRAEELSDELSEAKKRIEELVTLVESAYSEGWVDRSYFDDPDDINRKNCWNNSIVQGTLSRLSTKQKEVGG